MTAGRLYCIQSWNNASETSGEQIGNRLAQSRGLHFNRDGSANVSLYAEGDSKTARKTSIPLRQRIFPQEARLSTLDTQIEELNQEYNSNRMSDEEYIQLKTILQRKRDRAWELYVKAGGVSQNNDESEEFAAGYATQNSVTEVGCGVSCGVAWVDELSTSNCFKSFLKNTCKAFKLAVQYKHKMSSYLQSLKDL